jgi:hypothetical protein
MGAGLIMDANKLTVLREINYTIPPHCGICEFSDLSPDGWGYCYQHAYVHEKHSGGQQPLSINAVGSCSTFKVDQAKVAALGLHAFAEFLPPE